MHASIITMAECKECSASGERSQLGNAGTLLETAQVSGNHVRKHRKKPSTTQFQAVNHSRPCRPSAVAESPLCPQLLKCDSHVK